MATTFNWMEQSQIRWSYEFKLLFFLAEALLDEAIPSVIIKCSVIIQYIYLSIAI